MNVFSSRYLVGTLCCALLYGCADLTVKRITDGQAPQYGQLVYYLPQTRLKGTVTISVKECTATDAPLIVDEANARPDTSYKLSLDESVSIASVTEADPDFHYAISLEDARSWLKEINFKLDTTADNTFQSFNGSINDQAGPIGIAALTAAVKIAAAAVLPGVGAVPRTEMAFGGITPKDKQLCTPEVVEALAAIEASKKNLDQTKAKKVTDDYTQEKKDADLAKAQSALADAQKKAGLSRTGSFEWVPAVNELPTTKTDFALTREFDVVPLVIPFLSSYGKQRLILSFKEPDSQKLFADVKQKINVSLNVKYFTVGTSKNVTFGEKGELDMGTPGGIVLRQPAQAILKVCKGPCATPAIDGVLDTTNEVAPTTNLTIAQYGQIRVYPEHSSLFQNATLVLSTNTDGALTSVSDHTTSTAATGLAGLGTAADTATTAQQNRNAAITSANTAAAAQASFADSANKAHADCLTQKALIEAAGEKALPCQ